MENENKQKKVRVFVGPYDQDNGTHIHKLPYTTIDELNTQLRRFNSFVANDANVGDDVFIGDNVTIGSGCYVQPHATISSCVTLAIKTIVGRGATVCGKGATHYNQIIEKYTTLNVESGVVTQNPELS